jgi:hypothetical protein
MKDRGTPTRNGRTCWRPCRGQQLTVEGLSSITSLGDRTSIHFDVFAATTQTGLRLADDALPSASAERARGRPRILRRWLQHSSADCRWADLVIGARLALERAAAYGRHRPDAWAAGHRAQCGYAGLGHRLEVAAVPARSGLSPGGEVHGAYWVRSDQLGL